jgi:hypothetical protein
MAVSKTLAYYNMATITVVKSFIVQDLWTHSATTNQVIDYRDSDLIQNLTEISVKQFVN